MSDYRIVFEETFRFENLIASLRLPDMAGSVTDSDSESLEEQEGIWEARTALMSLVNALTNCPDSLEERILLRDEFGRRGLNEAIVVRLIVQILTHCELFAGIALRETSRCLGHAA